MSSIRHISPWKWIISVLYSVILNRKRSFFLITKLQTQRGLIQLPPCPLGVHLSTHALVLHIATVTVPDRRPRFVPSCQFFSKLPRKLTPNPVLSKQSPFANPPVEPQWPSPDKRPHFHGNVMEEHHACPEPSSPDPAENQHCPAGVSASLGHAWCCPPSLLPSLLPSLTPTGNEEFYFILCVPLSKMRTGDKMLLFPPLLISLNSFNCSLEAFSTLVTGIILSFPQRAQLPLRFTGISQGLNLFL